MDEVIQSSLLQPRLSAQMLAGFAAFGLALALIGLYGVISYSMEQRTREIAIRVSLGAAPAQVAGLVLWHGLRLAGIGLIVGVPLALGLSRILNSTLATTSPRDMVVFTMVPALLIVAALTATYVPTRRAMRIDPAVALRGE
jgi:ABC-type antimicrobial peptide transport system permease subunit